MEKEESGSRPDEDGFDDLVDRHPEVEEEVRLLLDLLRAEGVDLSAISGVCQEAAAGGKVRPDAGASGDGDPPGQLGDFRIVREIGRGGMGSVVYEAEQLSLKRRVALKLLPAGLGRSKTVIARFHREAEAVARLNHPGIAAVHTMGERDGAFFIVQELVEGGYTLASRLQEIREARGAAADVLREMTGIFAEVAEALQHAHETGVIHRDIKPTNILLTPEGRAKVIDFGLARVENALELSRTGDYSGTPAYTSPEQAMGRRMGIDHRTDVFSLGVAFFEALTLQRPFEGESTCDQLKKNVLEEARDPRDLNPSIPRGLALICLKAMEKKPEDRYQTMQELAEDFRRHQSGKKMRRFRPGRNRRIFVAAALVVTVLVLVFVAGGFGGGTGGSGDVGVERFDIRLFSPQSRRLIGTIGANGLAHAVVDDALRTRIAFGHEAFCYLVAFNPDGKVQLCWPESRSVLPTARDCIDYPENKGDGSFRYFMVTDGSGLQAIALLVSRDPLPPFDRWLASAGPIPWTHAEGEGVWRYDNGRYELVDDSRGAVETGPGAPEPFVRLCTFLEGLGGFDGIHAVAFPVRGADKP
jgi:serine/threonine protein kinase